MEKAFIAESIGNQYMEWNALDPVFIDAPTGTRKTTFVYEKIIPGAIGQGRTVLLVSNRIAVSSQQKRKIFELLKRYDSDSVSHITESPDKEIVDKLAFFGPVCVTTYQGLHGLLHSTEDSETNMYEWFGRLKSAVIVVALLLFIQMWNDLLQQIIYINTDAKFTIAIGLSQFKGSLKSDWSAIMCATCMSFIPGVVFYLLGQKYFVEGIVMTGMKN